VSSKGGIKTAAWLIFLTVHLVHNTTYRQHLGNKLYSKTLIIEPSRLLKNRTGSTIGDTNPTGLLFKGQLDRHEIRNVGESCIQECIANFRFTELRFARLPVCITDQGKRYVSMTQVSTERTKGNAKANRCTNTYSFAVISAYIKKYRKVNSEKNYHNRRNSCF
jgi:hypothetical protein